ncbi:MAG: MFS transporter [Candidatus Omnitrophica bacterium]|nr:MFS transporter [Candidatus Omnitrophota bacterium]
MTTPARRIHQSLDVSWKEGIPASMMLGVVDYYIVPFGLFLGATTQQIGFLVAVPQLVSSFSQLFAVGAIRAVGSRVQFLRILAVLQASLLLPISFLSLVNFHWQVVFLIGFMILFRMLGSLIATAWGSLVSDYLPPQKRGHYFGWRSQIMGLAALSGIAGAGVILFLMKQYWPAAGFLIIFFLAAACRFASTWLLAKMIDMPLAHRPEHDFSFIEFIRRYRQSNFVKFVLYSSFITFATFLSAPYTSVFILRDLHFDYLSYTGIQIASVTSALVSYPIWGKHADVAGNAKMLKITGALIPVIPIFWLAAPLFHYNPIYYVMMEPFAGFVWGGFNLCATNFIYDAVTPEKRVRCLGYYSLMTGVSIFCGALAGGYLAHHLPPLFGFPIMSLFLVSCLMRACVYFIFADKFSEVRENITRVTAGQFFLSLFGIRPLKGLKRQWNFFPGIENNEELKMKSEE